MADFAVFEDIPFNEYENLSQSQSQPIGSEFDPGDASASSSNFSDSQVNIYLTLKLCASDLQYCMSCECI